MREKAKKKKQQKKSLPNEHNSLRISIKWAEQLMGRCIDLHQMRGRESFHLCHNIRARVSFPLRNKVSFECG
jgi:hypothetical protein